VTPVTRRLAVGRVLHATLRNGLANFLLYRQNSRKQR